MLNLHIGIREVLEKNMENVLQNMKEGIAFNYFKL